MSKQTIKHSAITVGLIMLGGWVLQIIFGNFDMRLLAAPVNSWVGESLLFLCAAAALFSENRFVRALTGVPMSVCLILGLGFLALIMGFTPQGATPSGGVAAVAARLGFNSMTSSWPFVMVYFTLMVSLGALTMRRLPGLWSAKNFGGWLKNLGFFLNHAGLWVVFCAAGLGSADIERIMVRVDEGTETHMGYDSTTEHPRGLPMRVALHDFAMEYHEPLTPDARPIPRRYASDITLTTPDGATTRGIIEVNHPMRFHGWWVYQYGYDRTAGPESTYSIVEMVRDPWLVPVYVGFAMIALGMIAIIWRGRREFLVTALASGAVFLMIHLSRSGEPAQRVPALQSVWFVPHVASYILSYAMMLAATCGAIFQLIRTRLRGAPDPKLARRVDNFVYAGFGLLVLGMLMGAVWAKQAWGHYWEWDPKETWALVTTLAYLGYIHLRLIGGSKIQDASGASGAATLRREKAALWLLVVAFLALIFTWLGVNYLPSATGSIHVY
jgi:ABC-type transport system involved in cytochrome c biogenesis permease subunit